MHIVVSGGRDFDNYDYMESCLDKFISTHKEFDSEKVTLVVGMAIGADFLAIKYGFSHNYSVIPFEPNFRDYGTDAGCYRNEAMADYIKSHLNYHLVAFWDGKSRGTLDMIDKAKERDIPVEIFSYNTEE